MQVWNRIAANWRSVVSFLAWAISLVVLTGLGYYFWPLGSFLNPMSKAESIRDIALTVGAILGFPMLLQRMLTATKQADIDSRRLLADRYARAVELFSGNQLAKRRAGLRLLGDLAKEETKDYHVKIMELLCDFLRDPSTLDEYKPIAEKKLATVIALQSTPEKRIDMGMGNRPDVAAVLALIRERNSKQHDEEKKSNYRLNFRNADLRRADFHGAYLRGADFSGAKLHKAHFEEADLQSAVFKFSQLQGAFFNKADLRESDFSNSIMVYSVGKEHLNASLNLAAINGAKFNLVDLPNDIGVILTDDAGNDLPPGPPSLPDGREAARMNWEEWKRKRGKKAKA